MPLKGYDDEDNKGYKPIKRPSATDPIATHRDMSREIEKEARKRQNPSR